MIFDELSDKFSKASMGTEIPPELVEFLNITFKFGMAYIVAYILENPNDIEKLVVEAQEFLSQFTKGDSDESGPTA